MGNAAHQFTQVLKELEAERRARRRRRPARGSGRPRKVTRR
jgi:hypothetical protein